MFTGTIPSLGSLSQLSWFNIADNRQVVYKYPCVL